MAYTIHIEGKLELSPTFAVNYTDLYATKNCRTVKFYT